MTNNSSNNNRNSNLDGKWRFLAGLNVVVGCTVLIVQIATLVSLYEWVDWIGIGIWGGCFMISAGSLTIQRSPRLISMTICALLSGLALIIFYAWNLGVYNNNPNYYCYYYYNINTALCDWRMAADIIFIVCGTIAMVINLVLSASTSSIVVIRPMVRYPVNVNAYPMTTTNTTYVVTRPTTYPATQTVYQVPVTSYPMHQTTGVVYQTSPVSGYPMPQQQPQPMYYAPTNPPAYTTTTNY